MAIEQARGLMAPPVKPGGRIRAAFWATLAAALVLTLALPLGVLWHASTDALTAQACVWPSTPRAGAQAQALIVIPNHADDAALAGKWATAQIALTMPEMSMPSQRAEVSGPPQRLDDAAVFMLPIILTMPGDWLASVTLHTPGRPDWRDSFTVQTRPDTWAALPLSGPPASAAGLCGAEGRG